MEIIAANKLFLICYIENPANCIHVSFTRKPFYKETKIEAQAFEAEDFLNIFLRFLSFWGSFSYIHISLGHIHISLLYTCIAFMCSECHLLLTQKLFTKLLLGAAGAATGLIYQKHFTVNHTLKRSLLMDSCNFNKSRLRRRYLRWTLFWFTVLP